MNFLKEFKERVEGVPDYNDDYAYYLFDEFVKEFVPQAIENYFSKKGKKDKEIKISISNISKFFESDRGINNDGYKKLESVMPTIMEYIKVFGFGKEEGHIVIDPKTLIYAYYGYLRDDTLAIKNLISKENKEDDNKATVNEVQIDSEDLFRFDDKVTLESKPVDESPLSQPSFLRPMSVEKLYTSSTAVESDVKKAPSTPMRENLSTDDMASDYTKEIFEKEILRMLARLSVDAKRNNLESINVDFIVNDNSVVFNGREFSDLNRDEFMAYIVNTPCNMVSRVGNKAILEYKTEELGVYIFEELQRINHHPGRAR